MFSRNRFYKVIALLVTCACAQPAYAYLDPGTGSILLQALLAAIVGAVVAIKVYWFRLKRFVLSLFGSKPQSNRDGTPNRVPSKD